MAIIPAVIAHKMSFTITALTSGLTRTAIAAPATIAHKMTFAVTTLTTASRI
jgi:hypothetical protein